MYRMPCNHPNELYDETFACRFLRDKQMTACEQTRVCAEVVDCYSDAGLCRIQCCAVLHCNEAMSFTCGLSNTKISALAIGNGN